jgi:membrane protein implicated in regulation of membrane protease activity
MTEKYDEKRQSSTQGRGDKNIEECFDGKVEMSKKLCVEHEDNSWRMNSIPFGPFSTIRGMMMEVREELENAIGSIRRNTESDSIETDERDPHQQKHSEPRISTVRGMTMEVREERGNVSDLVARTKYSAPIWTINRRRRTGLVEGNFKAIATPLSRTNVTLSIVTAG